ncbi:MAG: hypothetical protein FD161_3014 [Limisphaerales bacterium]|nr:MAG: hypothetical protein FD161_3014 [Limisphaerales bacterium]KAG0508127.1 MAG: hypothetical protein E1N63_2721 [Limisphaerales bacterium]TXT53020.1 MAG: hypothetical protein FD140_128 [Limisphaerales bacterium]
MELPEILLRLAAHPDSARPSLDADPARVAGFLGLHFTPCGACRVEYHWGLRTFASQAELEGWLSGRIPASWQT